MPYKNLRSRAPVQTVYCTVCSTEGKTDQMAAEVRGWIVPRPGSPGGANQIKNQTPTGRYAHKACLEEAAHPGAQQGSMF